jgi:hypothetical protein
MTSAEAIENAVREASYASKNTAENRAELMQARATLSLAWSSIAMAIDNSAKEVKILTPSA